DNPPPSSSHIREALRAYASRAVITSAGDSSLSVNVRTAWNPFYHQPVPQTNNYGQITGYNHFSGNSQPAMIYALDARRGCHVAITAEGWSFQPTETDFLYDPIQHGLPDPRVRAPVRSSPNLPKTPAPRRTPTRN